MKCTQCQFDNPPGAKYCNECGSKLELTCPQCSQINPAGSKFCNECGYNLAGTSADMATPETPNPPEVSPATYAPTSVAEGERRQATVVFSDLSGYTSMNETLDPEEVETIMSRIKKEAVRIVERHDGIVNQFVGDEVLALFGIPTAHEDDPVRAVRAARELHILVRKISPEVEERIGSRLRMHSGISTGLVVTHLRDIRDGSYGITGDTVNVGARLAAQSESDEILISPETHRLVKAFFQTETLEEITVRGRARPTIPYRVTGESTIRTRFEAAQQKGFTAFTGRQQELATLNSCLDKAIGGNGQFVTILGEAGVGKSRLVYEFRHRLDRNKITVLQGRCQAYGASTPYFPHINTLKRGLNLRDEDTPAQLHEKVVATVLAIDSSLEKYLPIFLHLLSIPSERYPLPKHLHSQELSNTIHEALAACFIIYSKMQPMVLFFEDWHWADEASCAALRHLVSITASHPLMLLVIYRPEYSAVWANWSHHSPINLKALDTNSSEDIIKSVWGVERLPAGIAPKIHERTGGNPFFTEEISNALIEEKMVKISDGEAVLGQSPEHLVLPDTVQSVIRARLDRLDQISRESLRLASVIGREFARRLLEKISTSRDQLSAALEELKVLEMIQQIRVIPEAEYMFKHVITQEVTYETLLHQKRKELHGLVGQAIEELYHDRIEEQVDLLYRHFSLAEDWPQATEYGQRAANRAYRLGQFHEAVVMYDNARSSLEQMPDDPARQKIMLDLLLNNVWPLNFLGQQDRILEICKVSESLADALKDRALMGRVLHAYALANFFKNEYGLSEEYYLKILNLAGNDVMDDLIGSAKFSLAVLYISTGRMNKAAELYSEVITTREAAGTQSEYLEEQPFLPYSHSCHHLGYIRALQGNIKEAKKLIRKGSTPDIKQISNLQSRSYCTLWHSSFSNLIGENYGVMERVNEVIEIAEKTDSPIIHYLCYAAKGNAFMAVDQEEAARHYYEKALQSIKGTEHKRYLEEVYHNLIEATLILDDIVAAEKYYMDVSPLLKLNPGRTGPRFDYLKGRLHSMGNSPDYASADELFKKSIDADENSGAVVLAARTKYYRADLLARTDEVESGRKLLLKIRQQFQNWNIPSWQMKCWQALKTIAPDDGDPAQPS
jgi:class 3 adenylate cyclase/tetratricopeptide (TPR) repeat protein